MCNIPLESHFKALSHADNFYYHIKTVFVSCIVLGMMYCSAGEYA